LTYPLGAPLHCLTGCAIGEVLGMVIGTALGFSDWGTVALALVVAGFVALPVNRWLIARGKGHAVVHESGHHGEFPTRWVALVAAVAATFGTIVLLAEAL
jgi:hypothetical protein